MNTKTNESAITYDIVDESAGKPKSNISYSTPEEALKSLFGYDSFRQGQKEIIDSILSFRDTFAVMPTGAGKSICYQIPPLLLPGITLVISPLISLMQDQVKALNEAGVAAAFINSSLSDKAFSDTIYEAKRGLYKIIYAAPERLLTDGFMDLAKCVNITMVTVDEAHCISQWGQDFRPSYMKIAEFVKLLDHRPIISAFTATATENVRKDVVCSLGLVDPFIMVTGFNRENLFFQVEKPKNKDRYIMDYLSEHAGESGIIYCATRKNVDKLYDLLKSKGISAVKYHAGMSAAERKQMQDDFVFDYSRIVIATNAFGMGIDKSNVRFVIHYNMPQSMENYYQEAGRAGRDGLEANCILLFSPQDIAINKFLLEHKEMSDLDAEEREAIRERDAERLRIMERYCHTTECLRNYILNYFGENHTEPCGCCGNCLREFETLDMTDEAKKIINCVYEAKGRYGKAIIINTLLGAKTARLKEIGAADYKSYGVLPFANKDLLYRLMSQLITEGYLTVGDYQVIKLGNIVPLKNSETKILIKITGADKDPERQASVKKAEKGTADLTSAGYKLLDKLKALRLEIAREENMPPYIVFSDKTLIDMAAGVPLSKPEMLNVSGVGERKYNKYGERFIEVINECVKEYPELSASRITANRSEKKVENKRSKRNVKQEFSLLEGEAEKYRYIEYRTVSEIRDEMNRICERENVKKLPATRLTEILLSEGLIQEEEQEGRIAKFPTEKGLAMGIKAENRLSEKGNPYTVLKYSEKIQRMLVEHYIVKDNAEQKGRTELAAAYLPWTDEENKKLTVEFKSGQYSIKELSEIHGRTGGAIKARLKKLGLMEQ